MKKLFLIITTFALLLSCVSKKITTTTEKESFYQNSVDSLIKENKEIKETNKLQQDSIFQLNKFIKLKETTITKATSFETIIENPCDSLGKLKNINQKLGSENHSATIENINGNLKIVSKQNKDLISTNEKLIIENARLEIQSIKTESKHSQEISIKNKTIRDQQIIIDKYKSEETTKKYWSVKSILFHLLYFALILYLLRDKFIALKNKILYWWNFNKGRKY